MGDATETGRRVSVALGRLDGLQLHTLFTFSFTFIGVSVNQNFVLLLVSVASPLNDITLVLIIFSAPKNMLMDQCVTNKCHIFAVVRTRLVFANPVGEANDARKKTATFAAAFMGSAKMELAFVSADGTAFTVPWRAVPKAVEAMEAARPTSKENGAVTVIRVGKDPIVAFGLRPVVTMVMMMIKVRKYFWRFQPFWLFWGCFEHF